MRDTLTLILLLVFNGRPTPSLTAGLPPLPVASDPDGVVFGVCVCEVGRDEVNHPAEEPDRAYPREARQYEPQETPKNLPVVNLPEAGDEQTEQARYQRF